MIPGWLRNAITLDEEDGLDTIYRKFFDWFGEREFEKPNTILASLDRADIKRIPVTLGIGLLAASHVAAHLLPAHDQVYNLVQEVWAKELEPGSLDGLRGPNPGGTAAHKLLTATHKLIIDNLLGGPPIPTEK